MAAAEWLVSTVCVSEEPTANTELDRSRSDVDESCSDVDRPHDVLLEWIFDADRACLRADVRAELDLVPDAPTPRGTSRPTSPLHF